MTKPMTNTISYVTTTRTVPCSKKDERFADLALQEAEKSSMKYHQHGCVAVQNGVVLARGFNTDRCYSSDGFLTDTCSCHAEISVLRKLHRQSLVSGRGKRSCFLSKRKPVRCKKKQAG